MSSNGPLPPVTIAFLVATLATIGPAAATITITVDTTIDDNGGGIGCSLREAITTANTDAEFGGCERFGGSGAETIELPGGTSSPGLTYPISGSGLSVTSSVEIVGTGSATPIVDANGSLVRVLSVLDGTVRMSNLEVREGGLGGVFLGSDAVVELVAVVVAANTATIGAGIHNAGTLTMVDCTVTGNTVTSASGGGGIKNPGQLSATRLVVHGNTATAVNASGGGIHNTGGLNLDRSAIIDNTTTTNGNGAGIFNSGGLLQVTRSLIDGNNSVSNGGGLFFEDGFLVLAQSTVSNNSVTAGSGGGMFLSLDPTSSATLSSITVSGNTAATSGGGIAFFQTDGFNPPSITFSTVTNNTADADSNGLGDGGGINVEAGGAHLVTLQGTIVAANIDASVAALSKLPDCSGGHNLASLGHNLIGNADFCTYPVGTGDLVGSSASPINPLLAPLADNGGPTPTHLPAVSSPAVDSAAGGCANIDGGRDQRGFARPVDGNHDGTPLCDRGAVERSLFADGFETGDTNTWSATVP